MKYMSLALSFLIVQSSYACTGNLKKESSAIQEPAVKTVSSETRYPVLFEYEKKYPVKEIILQEIADVSYSKFSDKDVLFEQGTGDLCISDRFKILFNPKEGTVFVFDNKNTLIHRFNHRGGGPEEYQSINQLCADFDTQEIFIFDYPLKYRVQVYSFDGKFKRKLELKQPLWVESVLDYDKRSMLVCFNVHKTEKKTVIDKLERQYYLFSKESGRMERIDISIKYPVSNRVLTKGEGGRGHMFGIPSKTIVKNGRDVVISDYGSDTIYLKNDKGLFPFLVKSPSVEDIAEPTLVYAYSRTDKYTFLKKIIRRRENNGMKDFVVDNQTGEIFEIKLTNLDFPSRHFAIETFDMNLPENTVCGLLPSGVYIERNENNLLSGKLKELVSTLKEDDNDFMIKVRYK